MAWMAVPARAAAVPAAPTVAAAVAATSLEICVGLALEKFSLCSPEWP